MIATTLRHSETEARKEELTSVGWDIGNCLYQGEEVHIARNPDSLVRVDVTTTSGAPWLTALEPEPSATAQTRLRKAEEREAEIKDRGMKPTAHEHSGTASNANAE